MSKKQKLKVSWVRVGYIVITVALMVVIIEQISDLRGSLSHISHSNKGYDLLVLICILITYLFAALTYYSISFKPLKYIRTVIVGFGINVLNKLLPAGLGGIGGNYVYLRHNSHTQAQAAATVAANAILGVVANLSLLLFLIFKFPINKLKINAISPHLIIVGICIFLAVLIFVTAVPGIRKKLLHSTKIVLKNMAHYRQRKLRLLYGLLCQVGLTLFYVIGLSFSLQAVGVSLSIGSLMVAFSFAIWLGAVIPAPGGVGSVEAGLVAGLVAFKVDITQAVAAVLVFRLISFWIPLLLGIPALVWSFNKKYL